MTVSAHRGIHLQWWEKVSMLKMDLALSRCHLGHYFLYYSLLPYINLIVYLFPTDLNYDKLLPIFGSIYLLRITLKISLFG